MYSIQSNTSPQSNPRTSVLNPIIEPTTAIGMTVGDNPEMKTIACIISNDASLNVEKPQNITRNCNYEYLTLFSLPLTLCLCGYLNKL